MRALEYFVATSIDGFIAREDGDFAPLLVEADSLQALMEEYPETLPAERRCPRRRALIAGCRVVLGG